MIIITTPSVAQLQASYDIIVTCTKADKSILASCDLHVRDNRYTSYFISQNDQVSREGQDDVEYRDTSLYHMEPHCRTRWTHNAIPYTIRQLQFD